MKPLPPAVKVAVYSCKECPFRKHIPKKKGTRSYADDVCTSRVIMADDPFHPGEYRIHPSVKDALWHGFLPVNCPLNDYPEHGPQAKFYIHHPSPAKGHIGAPTSRLASVTKGNLPVIPAPSVIPAKAGIQEVKSDD